MTDKSTEVTTTEKPALTTGRGFGAIVPQDVDQAFRLAKIIATADMAPKSFNRDPNRIMVAIMHGLEVGLTPMAALQSIAVINGSPAIWGDGALALVQGSGLLADIEEKIDGAGDARVATCTAWRVGRETPIVRTFSVADAKKASLWGKAGPWTGYPERMMQMRARSWTLRDGFADVMRGLGVVEERRDIPMRPGDQAVNITPPPPPRPTRESVAVVKESLTTAVGTTVPAPPDVASFQNVDPVTGEVTETDALDELFRATMRDDSLSGSAVALPQAQRVDAPAVNEGLVTPPPSTSLQNVERSTDNKPRWIASNNRIVVFKTAQQMLDVIIPGIEAATPEQAKAARARNAAIMDELSAAGHREAMVKLSNALALREGAA